MTTDISTRSKIQIYCIVLGSLACLFLLGIPLTSHAASISRDNSVAFVTSAWNATSVSTSLTVDQRASLLLVYVYEDASDTITGVTAGGNAMTKIGSKDMCYSAGTHTMSAWYLTNPPSGNVNIVANRTGTGTVMDIAAISYIGASSVSVPDATASSTGGCSPTQSSLSTSITTNTDGDWLVMASRGDNGGTYSGTGGMTLISTGASGDSINNSLLDTNGSIGAATSTTVGVTSTVNGGWVNYVVAIAPAQISRDNSAAFVTSAWNATQVSTNLSINQRASLLVAFVYEDASDTITGVTAGGNAMTKIGSKDMCYSAGTHTMSAWYLTNPPMGTTTITATRTGTGTVMDIGAISYLGTSITGVPDATASATTGCGPTVSSVSANITPTIDNSWLVMAARGDNGGTYTGTGMATLISTGASGDSINNSLFDSNGSITPAGTQAMGASSTVNGGWVNYVVSIAP